MCESGISSPIDMKHYRVVSSAIVLKNIRTSSPRIPDFVADKMVRNDARESGRNKKFGGPASPRLSLRVWSRTIERERCLWTQSLDLYSRKIGIGGMHRIYVGPHN